MHLDALRAFSISPRLARALSLLALAMVAGVVGYMTIARMSFVDALYQTVTTLTTIGFREVTPFGTPEKIFTVFLVLFGVGTALYALTLVIEESLDGDIRSRFYQRRKTLEIQHMRDHYILSGFGRVGQEIARELHERREPFVVIEENEEPAERARAFGYNVIHGDAANERVLVEAGLAYARCLFAASDSDAGNTYITLTARSLNSGVFIVARAALPQNEEKLRLAGADRVLSLYSLGGRRMVLLALQPLAADFMDTLARGRQGDLILAEFEVTAQNGLAGLTASELVAGAKNATLLGIRHRDGTIAVGPRVSEPLHDGDIVIALAEEGDLALMKQR